VQKAIAHDYRADPAMAAACKEDVGKYCKDVKDGGGRKAACLVRAGCLLACRTLTLCVKPCDVFCTVFV
jgi:hypothetical protein